MMHVGIIGCGAIALRRHVPEYLDNAACRLAGFFDASPGRAAETAAQFGGRAYGSLADMLADPAVDAVSVCTSNRFHAPVSIAALQAGKHVLCEKPIAVTNDEAQAMIDAADKAGCVLMVGHNQRLVDAHRKARECVDAGLIGRVIGFRTTFRHGGPEGWSRDGGAGTWFFRAGDASMGVLGDLGIHKVDLVRWLLRDEVATVFCRTATLDKRNEHGQPIEVEDNAQCLIRMRNGVQGMMDLSWTHYGQEENGTVLFGTRGVMRICDKDAQPLVIERPDEMPLVVEAEGISTNARQHRSGVIDRFVRAVLHGEKPEADGAEGAAALRVVLACLESGRTGLEVLLMEYVRGAAPNASPD